MFRWSSWRASLRRAAASLAVASRTPRRRRRLIVAVLGTTALVALAVAGIARLVRVESPPLVPLSTLVAQLQAHRVRELVVTQREGRVEVALETPITVGARTTSRIATMLPAGAPTLADLERWTAQGASIRVQQGEAPANLVAITFILLSAGVLLILLQRGMAIAGPGSRFRVAPADRRLTLADVGGAAEAQADLRDVLAYLKDPSRFRALGARCPRGVLLVGPPGTGKTLLARAVAGESGRPVIVASGSDFSEMYVGVGARRVRELARRAREMAPCLIFIDEFDSLGGRRGRPNRSGEEETTLNQLLVEMDGMAGSEGVVWMAATNRADMLDPAVRRPGRFDRVVDVAMPTFMERVAILKVHANGRPLAEDVDLERVASLTVGHSGADLAHLLNEAALCAVHDGSDRIHMSHLEQARDRILLGRVREGVVVSDEERRLIALHEAGHAIVGLVACPDDRLHKVTIEPRGRSLGAAHFAPEADKHLYSRRYLEGTLAKALGGRAAELVFLGPDNVTSGAGSDLVQATGIARRMVAEFGMSETVGLVSADPAAQGGEPSEQLANEVDTAVRELLTVQARRAESIVREHRRAVEEVANALLREDALDANEVLRIAVAAGIDAAILGTTARPRIVAA